eukprot:CAMPEP_0168317712 /NCGR_PEP_ID=MMETSP0213-20121227/55_1 /TAXON_ID=151035 /ORGANISM="Euplotes harpa, Strain FSP1.4" /LENGTH=62 /DNA_ID=CAMNT_0008318657 /DNA_START=384 /DNA_END=572 /DNA_ORIENTATION=-
MRSGKYSKLIKTKDIMSPKKITIGDMESIFTNVKTSKYDILNSKTSVSNFCSNVWRKSVEIE